MSFTKFVIKFKTIQHSLQYRSEYTDGEVESLLDAFNELEPDDQKATIFIILKELKECHDSPLSKEDLRELEKLNSKEMVSLKKYVVYTLLIILLIMIGSFATLTVAQLFPAILTGDISLF